jgi:hypothetical protein
MTATQQQERESKGLRTGGIGMVGIIAADVIVMANLSQIAGSYSLSLFGLD